MPHFGNVFTRKRAAVDAATSVSSLSSLSRGEFLSSGLISSNKKLFGRETEYLILREAFDRISQPNAQSEVVLVHGESGTGKSAIVETLREYVSRNDFGYYASGKFDQLRGNEPYSAIVEALTDLVDLIQQGNKSEAVRKHIREELNGDIAIFAQLVGNSAFFGATPQLNQEDSLTEKAGQALVRLKLACRSFLRVVASDDHPVVLFIDDLQFSGDQESLIVLESMMTDSESKNVLIVAAYRDDEEYMRHLPESITLIGQSKKNTPLPVTNVHVTNFDLNTTNVLISDILQLELSSILPLSCLVLKKTHGNIYHTLRYIEFLQSEKLLIRPSGELGGWKWDLHRINVETDVSANVVDLLSKKMERLTTELQSTLKYAACIGCRFDFALLAQIVHQESDGTAATHTLRLTPDAIIRVDANGNTPRLLIEKMLSRVLAQAVKEGLIEEHSEHCYKWAHDRIQQCIYDSIEASRRSMLHFMIGELMMGDVDSSSTASDALVCSAVDHLIRGSSSVHDPDELVTMSRRCLRAAKIAISKSAYTSACEYLEHGILHLKTGNACSTEYELALQLHTLAAEMEYYCGNFDKSTSVGNEVLEHGRSLEDKMRVYYCFLSSLGSRGMTDKALDVGFSVLDQLDERLRTSKFSVLKEKHALFKSLQRMSDEDILSLPRMVDHKKKAAIRILNSMAHSAYWQMDLTRFTPITFRMMKLSIDMGLDIYSAPALANFALWHQIVGRSADAYRFALLAIRILRQLNARKVEARTLSIVYGFVMHWRRPLDEGICPFERCVENGVKVGDLDSALFGCNGLMVSYFYSASMELEDVQDELRLNCYRLKDYGEQYFVLFMLPIYQLVMCLCGDAEDPRELCGSALDGKAQCEKYKKEGNMLGLKAVAFYQLQLALYFAFSHYIVYGKTGRRANKKAARIQSRQVHEWVKQGNVNCEPMAALLKAEELRLKSIDAMEIKDAYDDAIDVASRMGFTHCKALSAERAGSAMMELGHVNRAAFYLRQSITLYEEWGATAKVWDMERVHKCLRPEAN